MNKIIVQIVVLWALVSIATSAMGARCAPTHPNVCGFDEEGVFVGADALGEEYADYVPILCIYRCPNGGLVQEFDLNRIVKEERIAGVARWDWWSERHHICGRTYQDLNAPPATPNECRWLDK